MRMIKVDGRPTRLRRFRVRLLVLSEVPAQYASVTVELLAANFLDAQEQIAAGYLSLAEDGRRKAEEGKTVQAELDAVLGPEL